MGDKKKGVGLMIALGPEGGRKESDEDDAEGDDYEPDDVEVAAGERLARATKAGDGAAIYKAFEDLSKLCAAKGGE